MNIRIVAIVALSCALLGLALVRSGSAEAPDQTNPLQEIPGLAAYSVTELVLPQAAGAPFATTVNLGGQPRVLNLEPHSVRSRDFQLLVDYGDGQLVPAEAMPPTTYRGTVQDVPGSYVAASLHNGSLTAHVVLNAQEAWGIEPMAAMAPGVGVAAKSHVVYRTEDTFSPVGGICGTDDQNVHDHALETGAPPLGGEVTGGANRVIELACDTDGEFFAQQGSDVHNTMVMIEATINGVDAGLSGVAGIYQLQINLVFEITTIIVRTNPDADPYSSNSCGGLLNQLTSTFNTAPENSIRRDVVQMFTGHDISGGCLGIAWLSTVCAGPAYNVVWPAGTAGFASRIALSAHEIGHNFSAQHCCGSCSGCPNCQIMCPCISSCSGVIASFGPLAINQISNWVASHSCVQPIEDPIDPPFAEDWPNGSIDDTKWTYNKGAAPSQNAINEPSAPYSLNLNATGSNPYQDDDIRTNMIDLTGQEASGWSIAFATQHNGVENGERLVVEYWGGELDLWVEVDTLISDGTNPTEFTQHSYPLSGLDPSPFHSEFRLRLRASVNEPNDNWYVDDITIGATTLCPWDCNDGGTDGTVGIVDFLALLGQWGNPGSCDFDGGGVGITDFLELLANWGPC